ncbi:MAG: hypothetical protein EBQ73_01525, partial [Gammaproteobacteria bacterium]|nr:hypothetical protein [Gammaproteobacteria bacterium]
MGAVNLNLTTVGVGNSTQIFPGTWQQILPSNLGTLYPDAAISIGYNCNGSAQNQSVTFSTPVTDPYLLFNYVDLGSVYNFSGFAGTVALVGNTVGATLSNNIITLATPGSYNQSSSGFAIQLPGTYSSINYTITNPSCNSGHDSAGFDVAETGFSITPTIGAHGTVTPNQVITVLPNTKASFSVTPDNGYVANMGGTCGGTFSGNTYTTSTVTQDCTVTASFVTNPQAQLNLNANPTGITVSSTSTLTTNGGSGTGAISYNVSGPCTINGNTLTGTAIGSCLVTATKGGDVTFAPATSNTVTVDVSLVQQPALLLSASNTGISIGGTSTLSTTGGSGSGVVSYYVISGLCTLNGAVVTATGAGECKLGANKAADATYASVTSNEVTIHVDLAPQATLELYADKTSILVGQNSYLSTVGGSGTGSVYYSVIDGPCTITASVLHGLAQGTCKVQATKFADLTYNQTTSNIVNVLVDLNLQQSLNLYPNPTGIAIGGISGLATSGGSGTGAVTFKVLSGPCTLSGNQLTSKAAGLCQVSASKEADGTYAKTSSNVASVYVVLAPQAALNLTASNTGIAVGSTSTLSTSGGSGTGTVAYQVLSGPCTLNGALLTGSGAGTCRVSATKAADGTYAQTSSNEESVYVVLAPQSALTLLANPTGIAIGGISGLATSGGSGSGIVTYELISGSCTLSGNQLTGKAPGLCQVLATKAADSTFAETKSNIESVYVVLAPQATLNLTASNTGIAVGSTSTLSTSGGSGTGTVAYQVLSGPCTLNGALLT